MNNVIESYLVSLGFEVKQPELAKFKTALKEASDTAERHTTGIAQQFIKWQGAIVGAFGAVGLATLGMMSKVADADLGYKLFAQRMFMGESAAKKLKIATDALGFSLEEITWNPELRKRFDALWADQKAMESQEAPGMGQTLERVRDGFFQITRLKVAAIELQRQLTVGIFNAMGGDAFVTKLQGWVGWLLSRVPQISQWLISVLVPILKDAWRVMEDMWKVAEKLTQAFIRLIGALSGDKGLKDGKLNMENFGKAIDKAADYMVRFVDAVTSAELVVIDLFNALVDLAHFDFKAALGDLKIGKGDLTEGGAVAGSLGFFGALIGVGTVGGLVKVGLSIGKNFMLGIIEGIFGEIGVGGAGAAGIGAILPLAAGAGAAYGLNKLGVANWIDRHLAAMGIDPYISKNASITDAAQRYGVDAALAAAVAKQESGTRQFDRNGNTIRSSAGALGMFQLMPDTARRLGVDPNDAAGNIQGGVHLLQMLMAKYGNVQEVLAAYNWGEGNLDAAMKKRGGKFALDYLPAETRNYVNRIDGSLSGRQINIHAPITVHSAHATPDQIKVAVQTGMSNALADSNRDLLLNAQGVY
jgi:hypothetical protein